MLILGALLWFARIPVESSYVVDMLPAMVLFGIGAGLSFPSLMTLAMSSADGSDAGLASGLVNTSLQVGGALGLAVLATLSTTRTGNLLAAGESTAEALTSGYRVAWIVGAGLMAATIAIAVSVLRPAPGPQAVEEREQIGEALPAYSEAA